MTLDAPAAILWDMDGTIVNTEPAWVRAEHELLNAWGAKKHPNDDDDWVGIGLWKLAAIFQERGVDLDADTIVRTLTAAVNAELFAGELDWMPGARELAADAAREGIPNVLVTMATREQATQVIARLPEGTFSGIIAGDDVTEPKPHPEPYERGAALLGLEPSQCVAIEDSVTGAMSASRAGAFVIGVPNLVDLSDAPVHHTVKSLEALDACKVVTLFQTKGTN